MRTRGPGGQHAQRRREIADGVLAVVAEAGLSAVSLSAVAERAGVSAGRVQHYFPARGDLISAAFTRANELASERIAVVLAASPTDAEAGWSPERRELTVVLTQLVPASPVAVTHLRVRQFFTAQALVDEQIADVVRVLYAHLHQILAALLTADVPVLPHGEPPHDAVVRLVALAEGLAHQVLLGSHSAQGAEAQVRAAVAQLYP